MGRLPRGTWDRERPLVVRRSCAAKDPEIMEYARERSLVVFTHDLDFGSILAVTHALGPSVIQARVEDPLPSAIGDAVVEAIRGNASHLERGALITIDPDNRRVRILPIVPGYRG